MQSFDQSLMSWYSKGFISYESALFYATSPNEFALRVQGVAGSSDNSWSDFETDETPS
jgi:twitching motility protein PilT